MRNRIPPRTTLTTAALITAALLGLGVPGRGHDRAAAATSATTVRDGLAAASSFCDGMVGFDSVSSPGGAEDPTPEELVAYATEVRPHVDALVAAAPADAAGPAATLAAAIDRAADGDLLVESDPDVHVATEALEQAVRDTCPVSRFDVTATDFAFDAPSSVDAGPISFRMTNQGHALHVLLLVKAPENGTDDLAFLDNFLDDFLDDFSDDVRDASQVSSDTPLPSDPVVDFQQYAVSGNFPAAEPGQSGTSLHDLTPGTYLYFCPIPVDFSDPAGPTHYQRGMYGRFTVSA